MRLSGRLVGIGKGRFEMLGPGDGEQVAGVRRAPAKPTLMAQAALRSQERRHEARRFAEDAGIAVPDYRPAPFIELVGDMCKWPIGPEGDLRCGAKQAPGPGQPYCERHRAMSGGRR